MKLKDYTFEQIRSEYNCRLRALRKLKNKIETCRGCIFYHNSTYMKKKYKLDFTIGSYCELKFPKIYRYRSDFNESRLFYGLKTKACENKTI